MLQVEPPLHVDLTQLPVEALLNALNRKPEAELREASGRLTALGAKVGAKVVALRQSSAKSTGKNKVRPDRTACWQCRRGHYKCDSQRPCQRCIDRGWAQSCSFDVDDSSVPLPKSDVARVRKKPPIQKAGYSASGDKLCEHNMEKRYCLHPTCVAQGGGKAMCKHGKRKRSCTEPECVNEMEERRRQIQQGRCKHGVQMRCCTQEECRIDFQLAGHQYREKLKERKRLSSGDPEDGSIKLKRKRGRSAGPCAASAPRTDVSEVEGAEMQEGSDGGDKAAVAAGGVTLACQDAVVMSVSQVGGEHALHLGGKEPVLIAANHVGHMSHAAPTPDDARPADPSGDVGEHAMPDAPAGHDRPAAELEAGNAHRPHEEELEMDKADMAMGTGSHEHVDDVHTGEVGHQLEAHVDPHQVVADDSSGIVGPPEHSEHAHQL